MENTNKTEQTELKKNDDTNEEDWIKEHIEKYGKEPNLFDGA